MSVVLSELSDGVLTLTLNRPEARNAIDLPMVDALTAAWAQVRSDAEVRAVVITGSDPAFCAGLDLKSFSAPDAPRHLVTAVVTAVPTLGKPVIAAVNGAAFTGGLELALGCDFILASEAARFADTHLKIGALSGSGMGARLPHAVGPRFARQMILTSEPIDPATALRVGLVNEVLAHDALLARAQALARTVASRDPELTGIVRGVIGEGNAATLDHALQYERDALADRKARGAMTWNDGTK